MIDHVGINVSDYERSKAFYVEALAPVGYELGIEREGRAAGFVEQTELGRKPSFWLEATRTPVTENGHISFGPPTGRRSTHSTPRRWPPAEPTMARQASGRSTTRTTTAPSSATPTATTSRRYVTAPPARRVPKRCAGGPRLAGGGDAVKWRRFAAVSAPR